MKILNRILKLFLWAPEEQAKFLSDKLEEMKIPADWKMTIDGFNKWQKNRS